MLVKCRYCENKVERNTAFKVVVNGKNEYYCSEQEYKQKEKNKQLRKDVLELINDIFGYKVINSALHKELKDISESNPYEKIFSYLYDNKSVLERSLNKSFSSEYGKIRYFSTIIKNNIVDYVKEEETPTITNTEYEVLEIKYKPKKQRRAMCDLERMYIDE